VDLGRQAAARATHATGSGVFFWATMSFANHANHDKHGRC
jgi:hypothetical protein